MPKPQLTEQEWSHFFDIDDIDVKGSKISIRPSEEEYEDLARRLGVVSIKDVEADLTITPGHTIHVVGEVKATLVQECVVTVEEFDTQITETIEGWFADKEKAVSFAAAKREREASVSRGEVEMVDEKEDPEAVIDGVIDLGELVTQHICLAIPAYPRKEGVKYEYGDENVEIDEKSPLRKNPFEALKDWKENR